MQLSEVLSPLSFCDRSPLLSTDSPTLCCAGTWVSIGSRRRRLEKAPERTPTKRGFLDCSYLKLEIGGGDLSWTVLPRRDKDEEMKEQRISQTYLFAYGETCFSKCQNCWGHQLPLVQSDSRYQKVSQYLLDCMKHFQNFGLVTGASSQVWPSCYLNHVEIRNSDQHYPIVLS